MKEWMGRLSEVAADIDYFRNLLYSGRDNPDHECDLWWALEDLNFAAYKVIRRYHDGGYEDD